MSQRIPLQLIVGPAGHGVVDYAADIAAATTRALGPIPVARAADAAEALVRAEVSSRVHVHVTDRLWGATPADAAGAVERLGERVRLSVTLHDVPQPSDGDGLARRICAYRRFVDAAEDVVVNSAHERALLAEHTDRDADTVIPLGVRHPFARDAATPPTDELTVLIAGFVYPGKGHGPAIDAAARAGASLRAAGHPVTRVVVRAIGRPSSGHEADVDALVARGRALGVAFEVTGFLSDERFARSMAEPGIPLAAHEHVSASRSILDWIEAGRRPLVVRSRYAEETATLRPGTLQLYDPDRLTDALAACVRDPSRTRLPAGTPLGPTVDDVAESYLARWAA